MNKNRFPASLFGVAFMAALLLGAPQSHAQLRAVRFDVGWFPGYYDGLAVVGFLLVILLLLFKDEKKAILPGFCANCANRSQRLASASTFCTLKCKYNPLYEYSYTGTYYSKAR